VKTVGQWAVVLVAAAACGGGEEPPVLDEPAPVQSPAQPEEGETLTVTSPAFGEGDTVPTEFTCQGDDTSPPLEWSGVPEDAAELRLTLTDPDAPGGTFTHWVVTGIDPATTGVEAGEVPEGGTEEENTFGETAYGGPCPPAGPAHTYIWTVEAVSQDAQVISAGVLTAEFGT
jgi:Raf kinase inhibitor-like YbhB/YbcL family protein